MVDAPEAINIASNSLKTLVPTFASLVPHVEEIRRSSEGDAWVITFRADNPDPRGETNSRAEIFFPFVEKIVKIEANSGSLLSIQNRSYD